MLYFWKQDIHYCRLLYRKIFQGLNQCIWLTLEDFDLIHKNEQKTSKPFYLFFQVKYIQV